MYYYIVIPLLQFRQYISEKKIIYYKKILHACFETYEQDRLWAFSVCCFKNYSGFLDFRIITGISVVPKEQSNACRLIYIGTGFKIGLLSKSEMG